MRADEEQLEELAQAWAAREISRKEWMAARAPIDARLEKARAQLARMSRTSPLLTYDLGRPPGRHCRRVGDRIVFDKRVKVLQFGRFISGECGDTG
ncbi:hypothetical protein ACQPYK_03515 [Streptosporangium sp. CA-135522]|uniref:hypothetical protein n=1 Tax=Streptosporangium sp. CA-135522 TaxID=3240072 RepID=UPI003D910A09